MVERCELDVLGVSYVGRHSSDADIYEIELRVAPAPGAPWGLVALKFRAAEATFLAHMIEANPPPARADKHLLDQVAGHDT